MKLLRETAVVASLLLACACGAGPGAGPELDGELEIGSAGFDGSGFVTVADGAEVELVPGAQGGFHVWLNLSVYNVDGASGGLQVEREARRVEDDALILRAVPQRFEVHSDAMNDWWQPDTAAPAFMCPSPLGINVFDREIYYQVRLVTDDGEILATDTLILTPRCPEGEQHDFCVSICSG